MTSQRCSVCAINWPTSRRYSKCPQCEEPTSPMYQAEPISSEEANRLANFAAFEREYGPAEVEA